MSKRSGGFGVSQSASDDRLEQDLAAVQAMVADKRQKVGIKYDRFITRVAEVLRTNYPSAFPMPDDQLKELVAAVDVIGEESRGLMKKLGEYCAGCGWCCSRTSKIVVNQKDAERISRELRRKTEDLFSHEENEWTIKDACPCQWWNPRNGRCTIYNIRPETCRTWPLAINERGQKMLHPVPECAFAVLVLADKVLRHLRGIR
ncbi:YkgJ family cysteine cluster protein [Dehalogenimonas alkenigignens]|uniref:YkgJ family cysteine cluster protein n=1 Tax=Dehalogenimonas alkenigignens TaxID=1217799 RepID=UPI00072FDE47|nr:YkgJ family cysteine cluster protein [Dehalogenimonas alkenigignens]PVV84420.1 YkgJ family cysteine cluster protein [Dehalogenimonas alkenigignens]